MFDAECWFIVISTLWLLDEELDFGNNFTYTLCSVRRGV